MRKRQPVEVARKCFGSRKMEEKPCLVRGSESVVKKGETTKETANALDGGTQSSLACQPFRTIPSLPRTLPRTRQPVA
jgi:hypothetical protein